MQVCVDVGHVRVRSWKFGHPQYDTSRLSPKLEQQQKQQDLGYAVSGMGVQQKRGEIGSCGSGILYACLV